MQGTLLLRRGVKRAEMMEKIGTLKYRRAGLKAASAGDMQTSFLP